MTTRLTYIPGSGFVDNEDLSFNTTTPSAEAHNQLTTRVHTGAITYQHGADEAQQAASGRYSAPITGTQGDSVMATLSKFGTPSVEMQPGNPASRTSLEVAARMGLIRMEGGAWVDAVNVEGQAAALDRALRDEQPEPKDTPDPLEVFDRDQTIAFADAIAPIPQHAFDIAQSHAIAGLMEGQTLDQLAAEVGAQMARNAGQGMEPADGAAVVEQGYALYEDAVARAIAAEGVGAEAKQAFYKALREGHQGPLQDAVQKLVYGNDTSGFRALARQYANANPTGAAAALKAVGWEVARTAEGWVARSPAGTGDYFPVDALFGIKKAT